MITIGLLAYNKPQFISRAINSVLNQNFKSFSLIISDDSSNNDVENIVNSKYSDDSRITYIRRPRIGMTNNFVATMLTCTTKYFIWLCDDDYLSEDYLEKTITFLEENNEYALVTGTTRFFDGNGILDRHEFLNLEDDNPSKRVINYFRKVNSNIILYGVMKTAEVKHFIYPDIFGADLFWSSQVVCSGKVKILGDTFFYYNLEGISSDTQKLAEYYNRNQKKKNPYLIVRNVAFNMIIKRKGAFRKLKFIQSKLLSFRVWLILRDRFCLTKLESTIRQNLKLRSRWKFIFR
ncbi:MAG TPA: glycosyltransferase family A protein [Saprospiraceae bacterium]|nr:glycosyltransferase family A protein [Saprospiraceae bacterium]HNT19442.1 glycosyltransferase family A protein [Saprospiraceae bacterium]